MSGQPPVSDRDLPMPVPRKFARAALPSCQRGGPDYRTADGGRISARGWTSRRAGIIPLLGAVVMAVAGVANAQTVIDDVNNAMLNIIQNTSSSLIDGPPEVANEIALVDGAMYDAVNAASGGTYAPLYYTGGAVPAASVNASAAALQAAVTVMTNLYLNGLNTTTGLASGTAQPGLTPSCPTPASCTSLYAQYAGTTASAYYSTGAGAGTTPTGANYTSGLVGPSAAQMKQVAIDVSSIQTELNSLNTTLTPSVATNSANLGNAAAQAAIVANNASGSQAAMVATLTPYVAPGSGTPGQPGTGTPGVYVSPGTRPALQPTWGSSTGTPGTGVVPVGMTQPQIAAVESAVPAPLSTTDLTGSDYALQVLQTECEGASSSLVSIESVCMAHNFAPETAAQAQAALFWNDPGTTIQPPGHWLQIADTVTADTNSSLLQTARATALAAIAMEDAGIAAWEVKYQYNAWRPITAIQDCSGWSTNFTTCDSTWSSLINTPPHPDYLAGHPAFSGAAATALEDALGVNDLTFTSTSNNYCNSGTTSFDSQGNVISCTVVISEPTGMTITSCPASDTPGVSGTLGGGNGSSGNPQTCTYVYTAAATAGASCVGGTAISDSQGYVIGCTGPDGAMSVTGGDCNNAGAVSVLNSDGSVNSAYNASPLICSIAESFDSISQASGGYLGAEFSRVVGGIHTPDAVTEALALGDDIGNIVASQDLPEPPIGQTLAVGLLILGVLRFRSRSRGEPVDAA